MLVIYLIMNLKFELGYLMSMTSSFFCGCILTIVLLINSGTETIGHEALKSGINITRSKYVQIRSL